MELILHLPHSSVHFPHRKGFLINETQCLKEAEHLGDLYTEELFYPKKQQAKYRAVVAGFSRVFCDAERYEDDEKEIMSRFGLGATYTHNDDGKEIRKISAELREEILSEYYRPHHKKLERYVDEGLAGNQEVLIVDCHSFPHIPFHKSIIPDSKERRPDICIGTDSFHTSEKLTQFVEVFFKQKGYSVSVNSPYSGSMVTSKHHRSSRKLSTIMVEVNRRLYMDERTKYKLTHNGEFQSMQDDLQQLLSGLKNFNEKKIKYEVGNIRTIW